MQDISKDIPKDIPFEMRHHVRIILWSIVVLIAAGALALLALAANEIKSYRFIGQGIQASNIITVAGKGEVEAVPDIAQFSFGASADGKTPSQAQSAVTAVMNPIIAKLKSSGIDEKDIQTTDYQIYPKYTYETQPCPMAIGNGMPVYCPPNGRQTLVGYTETHMITVKVRDVGKAGDVVVAATALGATNVSGISFIVDKQDEKLQEARRLAIADARAKADVLAHDLGVHIVSIVSFSDEGQNFPVMYGGMGAAKAADIAPAAPRPDIPQGQNKITSTVSIVYAIE